MEIRDFAERVLLSADLNDKLAPPREPFTDVAPGSAHRVETPARVSALTFCARRQTPPMPSPRALTDARKRAVAHHIMANHELQALEVMAFVACAFPEAPALFRRGLVQVMQDEQRHTAWHVRRVEELGLTFGALPVNGYFWAKAQEFDTLLAYLAGLPLTFEGRNLDHTLEFEEHFLAAADSTSAGVMRAIHRDEIRHVAFGMHWLRQLKSPEESDWEAFTRHLKWPLRPEKARGRRFHAEPRAAAGLSPEFIAALRQTVSETDAEDRASGA